MHLEPLQNVGRVEEPHHGHPARGKGGDFRPMQPICTFSVYVQREAKWTRCDLPRGDVHRINIVAIYEGVELGGGRRSFVSSGRQQGQLLTFLELLQVQNGLGV